MGFLSVLAAAAAAWFFGAGYYMLLSKPWIEASGVAVDENGRPAGGPSALPFILSAVCMLLVAGMMRHIFTMSAIATVGGGAVAGFGIGLFFIAPWVMINNAYAMRPFRLTAIDGGYAVLGCTIIGAVLMLI
jgi:hypothetical protein